MRIYILFFGVLSALFFGPGGLETLLSRNNKEEQKKVFFDLLGCHWYMPFVIMALHISGIYTSIELFFEMIPPSQEDFIFDIICCVFSVVCFIGLIYDICLIGEYMKTLIKD